MSSIGSILFEECVGFVPSFSATRTEEIQNPALVPTRGVITLAPSVVLTYMGWQAAPIDQVVSQLPGQTIWATDQSGGARSVFVDEVVGFLQRDGERSNAIGYWCELRVRVTPWA